MKVDKKTFIQKYTSWLERHLEEVLPETATEFRMVELARRQHHHDVRHLMKMMEGGKVEIKRDSI